MGKKSKIGKQRKDKFYQLAKETGYRSRAAFKLIQLNRKFGFLQNSRVCVDLCAAPGGWMQVAQQNMPLSSVVVGVDLFPIKSVPGCISLVEDITTEKCKSSLSKELKTWKADVVLHDGAPNVGVNWLHDAYGQATLTLSALKLATNFLREGGWFVTKVFRSKDYHSLIWVFKQLFKKVHATKPQASRTESAEIFVVCQYYIAPDSIDPKFLDHKYVFAELDIQPKNKLNILLPEKKKKPRAEGYPENDYTLHHAIPVSDFINKSNVIEALQSCNQIIFDDKEIELHPTTTVEIKECCKDLKVLSRKDLKILIKWWKGMKDLQKNKEPVKIDSEKDEISEDKTMTFQEIEDMEDEDITQQIANLQEEESKDEKRKKKKAIKERKKLNEKMNLKMVIKGDSGPTEEADDLFKLQQIKSHDMLTSVSDQKPDFIVESDEDTNDELKINKKKERYNPEETRLDSSGLYYKDSDSEIELESESEDESNLGKLGLHNSDSDDENSTKINKKKAALQYKKMLQTSKEKSNPILVDLDTRDENTKRIHKAEMWFQKDIFKNLEQDDDEDLEIDRLAEIHKKKGGEILGEEKTDIVREKKKISFVNNNEDLSDDENINVCEDNDDDSTSDSDYDVERPKKRSKLENKARDVKSVATDSKNDEELKRLKKLVKMDAEGLALGTLLATSRKRKRDLIDAAWNRYTFNDTNLPDWFVVDENKHMKRETPVPEELVNEYKKNLQEINVRPIKKVMEAKARKKKRALRRMEKAKKKVETMMENVDISDKEKARQIKQLYKKAKGTTKKEVTYVVTKKFNTAKRLKRPSGVKGPYKAVDPRMKKDLRAMKAKEKTKGRKKSSPKNKFTKTKKSKLTKVKK